MQKIYKIANPEGLSEAQIQSAEAYMNRACNSAAKQVISTVAFICTDITISKITEGLIKVALETTKINPFARVVITVGESIIGFVAGQIISNEIEKFYDSTVETIAVCKSVVEEAIKKSQESGEDIVIGAE